MRIPSEEWILESHREICCVCRKSKEGSFLILRPKLAKGIYLAICEKCANVGEKK